MRVKAMHRRKDPSLHHFREGVLFCFTQKERENRPGWSFHGDKGGTIQSLVLY